ncbi:MAG: hypothetical protein WA777_08635 [Rhodanobacter sp.]
MFRISVGFVTRKAVASGLLAAVLSSSAIAAQPPSTGLGQSWPNATDVSVSPHYHVYVFMREGIRYIQVNDMNGTVRGAIATANHNVLVLPIGSDAASVSTLQSSLAKPATAASTSSTETVYSDSALQITATPQSSGVVLINIMQPEMCTDPLNCTAGGVIRGGSF